MSWKKILLKYNKNKRNYIKGLYDATKINNMCLICVEIDKEKLSFREAWRNFKEMERDLSDEHITQVKQKIIDKMVEEKNKEYER